MTRSTLLIIATMLATTLTLLTGCGGSGSDSGTRPDDATLEATEMRHSRLAHALNEGRLDVATQMADSMSLFVDDLTPEQTVQVLMAFLTVHNDAVAKGETRRDLETLRKYVDVYDIALSVNPSQTRDAFAKAKKINPAVDFDSVAASFRERLTQYDAIHDGSLTASEPEPADTVATDTAATIDEVPVELRPAE